MLLKFVNSVFKTLYFLHLLVNMHNYFNNIFLFFYSFRYFTIRKLFNFCKLVFSYLLSIFGIQKLIASSPFFISIEPANYCNLQCPECPVGNQQLPIPPKTLFDIDLSKKLVDELKPTLFHIIFYFQGEPFINNNLSEIVSYAHNARIFTSTSTNGQFLSDKNVRGIVLSGLDKLIVSVDGSTQEVYESYRVGSSLSKTIEGIKRVVAFKKEMKSVTPIIEIQFLVLKTNEHQMDDMKQLAKSLGVDRLTFKTAQLYNFENGHDLLTTKASFARYKMGKDGKYVLKGKQPNHCWRLWSGSVINSQGDILPCCFDKKSNYVFGNVKNETFVSEWQNKNASNFRDKVLKNRKQFDMCRNCTSK